MTKWLRLKGRPSCQSLCWRSHLESVAQDCVQMTLEYSPGWRLSNLSGQPTCQSAATLTNPKCVLMFEGSFRERVSVKGQQRAMWPCLPAQAGESQSRAHTEPPALQPAPIFVWSLTRACFCPLCTLQTGVSKQPWDSPEPPLWAEEFKLHFLAGKMLHTLQLLKGHLSDALQ